MPERQVITSLAGLAAPFLTVPTSNPDSVDAHSIWAPRKWKKSTPFVIDDVTLTPQNQQGMGFEMSWELAKQCHMVKSVVMRVGLPPHTLAVPGTAAVVDHFGFALIEYFRTHFGSNLCYDTQPHDLYFRYRKQHGVERRDAINEMVGGDQTLAQRTLDLQNGREYYIPLYQPFEQHQSNAMPLLTLSQKLRFNVRARALANLLVGPGAATATPNGQYTFELIFKMVNLTGDEAAMILNMSRADKGIAYMMHQHIRQNSDEFASSVSNAQASFRLSAFTKPMKKIFFAFIPRNLINDTGNNDIFMFAPQPTPVPPGMNPYNPIVSYEIIANGLTIQRRIPRNYDRVYNHQLYTEAPHGDEIFNQFYNEYPNSFNAAIGYLDYTNFNNPVLNVTFGVGGTGVDPVTPANPQTLRLIANGEDYNFQYYQNGNFTRTFN